MASSTDKEAPPDRPAGGPAAVRLVDVTPWPAPDWDRLAVASKRGDVFQSHAWVEHKRGYGWEARRFLIRRGSDAADVLAAVSLQERPLISALPAPVLRLIPKPVRRVVGRLRYVYAPRGPILLRSDPASVAAVGTALRSLARRRAAIAFAIDPAWLDEGPEEAAIEAAGFEALPEPIQVSRTAMIVPLFEDEHEQHAPLTSSAANNINRARRQGVTVERVDLTDTAACEADLSAFYDVLADTGRRRGFIVRDRDYQLSQWRALGADGLASLWWARHEGRRVTGVLILQAGDRLISHQAGSSDEATLKRTRANHLLQWEIIRWGAANGYRTYDLGGVDTRDAPGIPTDASHPLWNLFAFKESLGAKPVLYGPARELHPNLAFRIAWRMLRRFAG